MDGFSLLQTAKGALRFLKDYMTDDDTLAESYFSFAEAYACGGFLPEAVSCFVISACYFVSDLKREEALSDAFYYEARFGKKIVNDLGFAIEKIGKAKITELKKNAVLDAKAQVLTDPIECSDEFLRVRYDVEKMTDEILAEKPNDGTPFCISYWETKKSVLKENYAISWKSPADMNPDIRFY